MDLDNIESNTSDNSNNTDIEQSLLQQFSCMGTTDRDELVEQMRYLLGPELNYSTAVFFLDMNNWNLQKTIGSYFDMKAPVNMPSMTLVSEPPSFHNDTIEVEPDRCFEKTWYMCNDGTEPWPLESYIQCVEGADFGCSGIPIPLLIPGEKFKFSVVLRSPSRPGLYHSKWRLCTRSGACFGESMWLFVSVLDEQTVAVSRQLSEQLSNFNALGAELPSPHLTANPFNNQQRSDFTFSSDTEESRPIDHTDINMS